MRVRGTSLHWEIKVKISKLDSNKLETIASEANYQQNEMRTKWETILGSGISHKRLKFKIYKEQLELNNNNDKKLILKLGQRS